MMLSYLTVTKPRSTACMSIIYFLIPILDRYPVGHRRQLHADLERFRKFLSDIIEEKKKMMEKDYDYDEKKADLLTLMIKATKEEDGIKSLSNQELIVSNTFSFHVKKCILHM